MKAAPLIVGGLGVATLGMLLVAAMSMAEEDQFEETGGLEPDDETLEPVIMSGKPRSRPGEFFSWDEVTRTSRGPNPMPDDAKLRFEVLHDEILDPLRRHLKRPVNISSGFRSPAVNKAVGGSKTSRHLTGEAVDIKVNGVSPEAVAATIVALGLPYDQVIWYDSWVHVGIRVVEGNRGETMFSPSAKTYIDRVPRRELAVV